MRSLGATIQKAVETGTLPLNNLGTVPPIPLPWFKLDADYMLSDIGLRECPLAARGLYQSLLCLMHKGQPYGHLARSNTPLTFEQIATGASCRLGDVRKYLPILIRAGLLGERESKMLYSPYLIAKAEETAKARYYGQRGGNPRLNNAPPP